MSFRQLIRYLRKRDETPPPPENPRRCAKCRHFQAGTVLIEGRIGNCVARPKRFSGVLLSGISPLTVLAHNTCKDRTVYNQFDDFEPLEAA